MWVFRDGNSCRRKVTTQSRDILYVEWGEGEEVLHMVLVYLDVGDACRNGAINGELDRIAEGVGSRRDLW